MRTRLHLRAMLVASTVASLLAVVPAGRWRT